jgi:hypothetical protein
LPVIRVFSSSPEYHQNRLTDTGYRLAEILNAYVTPLPETRKQALGNSSWKRVRDAVLAVYA